MATQKRCPKCETYFPIKEFKINRNSVGGRGGYCKTCHNEVHREYYRMGLRPGYKYNEKKPIYRHTHPKQSAKYMKTYMSEWRKSPENKLRNQIAYLINYNDVDKPTQCECCGNTKIKTYAVASHKYVKRLMKTGERLCIDNLMQELMFMCSFCRAEYRDQNKK